MASPGPLVTADWLAQNLDDPALIVADVRWYLDGRSGREAYARGHIPGAVFVDLDTVLAGPAGLRGRHPLPDPEAFAAAMSAAGIGDATTVVSYDDAFGSIAARLWWMLDVTGHRAAVLDGGIQAWPGALDADAPMPSAAPFTPRPWPQESIVTIDELRDDRASLVVFDARSPERYRGDIEPIDARAGHIPDALSAPWAENIEPTSGRMLPPERLKARFAALGVDEGRRPVAYCGSGVTACHNLLALRLAGVDAALYPGSWSEWAQHPDLPASVGEPPRA